MAKIDENQEAIAQIQMFLDQFDEECKQAAELDSMNDEDPVSEEVEQGKHEIDNHYSLGSSSNAMKLFEVEQNNSMNPNFSCFTSNLLEFLTENIPNEQRPLINNNITVSIYIYFAANMVTYYFKIQPFKCLYVTFQSMEDWRLSKDILRCNPIFHRHPRFNFVAINTNPISFAQLLFIFTCKDSRGWQCDLALVQMLVPSALKLTWWEGMQAFEEDDVQFICLKYIIRGCHFIPFFSQSRKKIYFLNDLVDNDTFVRFFLNSR